jgi:hypothetical protein
MGNCTGFCVSNNNVPSEDNGHYNQNVGGSQRRNVTSDKVHSAMIEKDEMFREDGGAMAWENGGAAPEGPEGGQN